ncbi:hypothetical protein SCUP515_08658 [Seiridium cupressi]
MATIAVPLGLALRARWSYNASTTVSTTIVSPASARDTKDHDLLAGLNDRKGGTLPILPAEVLDAPGHWVVALERVVSNPISVADRDAEVVAVDDQAAGGRRRFDGLMETYLRTTMALFARTPQAWFMDRLIKDPAAKQTFGAEYLARCGFAVGDRVCGVYVVTSRTARGADKGGEMVVLTLAPPEGWTGPVVRGRLVVGYECDMEDGLRLLNETVLWRRKGENPLFLERVMGKWMHSFMVQWMVSSALRALTRKSRDNKSL